ncbi:unnamed protein product [Hapterophycus canaliculatus]
MEQLVNALEEEEFNDGDCIVRQGEVGHFFYILQGGGISVHRRGEEGDDGAAGGDAGEVGGMGPQISCFFMVVANEASATMSLLPGSYFGERALLSDEIRKATCVAVGPTLCLSLGREDFSSVLGPLEDIMSKAAGIEVRRGGHV